MGSDPHYMHHSESIILAKRPLREADLLITFFSREDGKIKGVARSAKKSKRRFGGIWETGYVIDIHYATSARSDLASINQASLVAPRAAGKPSLASTSALWLAMELASRFLPEAEANREKFDLLRRFVTAIHEERLTRAILLFFLLKWIGLSGYLPDLTRCVKCGADSKSFNIFSAGLGGLVCDNCSPNTGPSYSLRPASPETLRMIMSGNVKCDISDKTFEDLLRFVFHYSMVLLGRPLEMESYLPMLMEV